MRVKFVPPKRKSKSSSKPARSPKPKRRAACGLASVMLSRDPKGSARRSVRQRKASPLLDTRVIFCGDNLQKLADFPDASVDLIYIDPPFNSNRNYEVFWGEMRRQKAETMTREALRCRSD